MEGQVDNSVQVGNRCYSLSVERAAEGSSTAVGLSHKGKIYPHHRNDGVEGGGRGFCSRCLSPLGRTTKIIENCVTTIKWK
jgi:hypothetical protein